MATLSLLVSILFTFAIISDAADYSISCGGTVSAYRSSYGSDATIEFVNPQQQSVVFTNCQSGFDTTLYLYRGTSTYSGAIQSQSTNYCDGDDCVMSGTYSCSNSNRETFQMTSLSAGTYTLSLGAYSSGYGWWYLSVYCSSISTTETGTQSVGESCNAHSNCYGHSWQSTYCNYANQCAYCSTCYDCNWGVDDTCDSCSSSYPSNGDSCSSSTSNSTSYSGTGSQQIDEYCNEHSDCDGYDEYGSYGNTFCTEYYECQYCSTDCDYCDDGINGNCDSCSSSYPRYESDCSSNTSTDFSFNWYTIFAIFFAISLISWIWRRNRRKQQRQQQEVHAANQPAAQIVEGPVVVQPVTPQPATSTAQYVVAPGPQPVSTPEYVPQPLPKEETEDEPQLWAPNSIDEGGASTLNSTPGVQMQPQYPQTTQPGALWSTPTSAPGYGTAAAPPPAYGDVGPPPAYGDAPPAYDQVAYQ